MPSFPDRYGAGAGDKLKFDHELLTAATIAASAVVKKDFDHVHAASAPVAAEVEPLCRSFIVDQGIFDDVDESFFGFEKNLDYPESAISGGIGFDSIDGTKLDTMLDDSFDDIFES